MLNPHGGDSYEKTHKKFLEWKKGINGLRTGWELRRILENSQWLEVIARASMLRDKEFRNYKDTPSHRWWYEYILTRDEQEAVNLMVTAWLKDVPDYMEKVAAFEATQAIENSFKVYKRDQGKTKEEIEQEKINESIKRLEFLLTQSSFNEEDLDNDI